MDAPRLPKYLHVILLYSLVAIALLISAGLTGCQGVSPTQLKGYHDARVLEADGQAQDNVALQQGTLPPAEYLSRAHQRVEATGKALPDILPTFSLAPPPGQQGAGGVGWLQILTGSGLVGAAAVALTNFMRNASSANRTADDIETLQKHAAVVAAMPAPLAPARAPPAPAAPA